MDRSLMWAAVGCGFLAASGCDTASVEPIDGGGFRGSGESGATSEDGGAGVAGTIGSSAGTAPEAGGSDGSAGTAAEAGVSGSAGSTVGQAGGGGTVDGWSGGGGAGETAGPGGNSGEGGSDVVGTVVDAEGAAVASTQVEIDGQLVMTDATGGFTVHHVPETYSAVIVFIPPPHGFGYQIHRVEVYDELTTRSPHFRLGDAEYPTHGGGVTGLLLGAGFSVPEGHQVALTASNSDRRLANGGGAYIPPATYHIPVFWASEAGNKFTFGALEWSAGNDGLPTGYDGWANDEVVPPINTYVTKDLVLAPVDARTVTGTITKPTDCVLSVLGTVGGINLFTDTPTTGTFSYLMPEALSGATVALTAKCSWSANPYLKSSASVGLNAANSVDLAIPAPPRLTLPFDQVTGVSYTTPFSWEPGDNQLRAIEFVAGDWAISRYGTGASSTLPDLTRFGVTIAPSSAVSWNVSSVKLDAGTSNTWDDVTGTLWNLASTGHSIFLATSETRTFTFAP